MPGLFNHTKPSSDKNFFQNYGDHLNNIRDRIHDKVDIFRKIRGMDNQLSFLCNELIARISIFERLRDGHDYFDEVLGATIVPAIGVVSTFGALGATILELGTALGIRCGAIADDYDDHLQEAGTYFMLAAAAFVGSVISFFKSAISLLSRPIATLAQGYAKQDKDRFTNEEEPRFSFSF